jgi:hypothetical protein
VVYTSGLISVSTRGRQKVSPEITKIVIYKCITLPRMGVGLSGMIRKPWEKDKPF